MGVLRRTARSLYVRLHLCHGDIAVCPVPARAGAIPLLLLATAVLVPTAAAAQEVSSTTAPATSVAPSKPTQVRVSPGNKQVTISWSDPNDSSIIRWEYQRRRERTGDYGAWKTISGSAASTTSYTVKRLMNGVEYAFRVRARSLAGAGATSEKVTATPKAAVIPTLTATANANGKVTLAWTVADNDLHALVENAASFASWDFRYRPSGRTTWTNAVATLQVAGRTSNHRATEPHGSVLEYQVRARGNPPNSGTGIYGPWSNVATATITNASKPALTFGKTPVTVATGLDATYTVALTEAWAGTLAISSDDTDAATVKPSSLTFTASDYNQARTVTVTGVAEGSAVIDHAFRLAGADVDFIPNAGTARVTVGPRPPVTISAPATLSVTESAGAATVKVTASRALGQSVTFSVEYGGTATGAANPANGDYDNDAVTSVTFGPSDTTRDIVIPITDDDLDEDVETITVTIALAPGSTLPTSFALGRATTTVRIEDNDLPELSFWLAHAGRFEPLATVCPRVEPVSNVMDRAEEGDMLALHVLRNSTGTDRAVQLQFEILGTSVAGIDDLAAPRNKLTSKAIAFTSFANQVCHYLDIEKDKLLEGTEVLSIRLKPRKSEYTVAPGADTRHVRIREKGATIRLAYKDVSVLGIDRLSRTFYLDLEAGTPSPAGDRRDCSFSRDRQFSGAVNVEWRINDGRRGDLAKADLSDLELPKTVRFRSGVARVPVTARRDEDKMDEDFEISHRYVLGGDRYLGVFCEPPGAVVPPTGFAFPHGVIWPSFPRVSAPRTLSVSESVGAVEVTVSASEPFERSMTFNVSYGGTAAGAPNAG